MNEREDLDSVVERSNARFTPLTDEEIRARIDRGYLEPERGEVVDGEAYCAGLLAELDDMERPRPNAT